MSTITRKYTLEGLDCANCAMKIEEAITKIDGIENVSVVFATKTLSLKSGLDEHELFDTLKKTIDSVEDGVTLIEKLKLITNIITKTVNIAVVVMNTTTNTMSMNIITKMANIAVVSKNITTNIIIIAILITKQESILYKTSIVLIVL